MKSTLVLRKKYGLIGGLINAPVNVKIMSISVKALALLLLLTTTFFVEAAQPGEQKSDPTLGLMAKAPLDKVIFQIAAKQWVNAQKALLSVQVNATFNSTDIVKARTDIMSALSKIAPGEWHITDFNRGQESSGLDKLEVTAEARVASEDLNNIYQNAKSISKPGVTYSINKMEFKPSLEEEQVVKKELRDSLYQRINSELAQLNKTLVGQNYTVHQIIFTEDNTMTLQAYSTQPVTALMANKQSISPPIAVSNELTLHAIVELASNRSEVNAAKVLR